MAEAWGAMTLQKRIVVVAATLGMFLAVIGLARMASQPRYELLYAGLEPAVAGDVIAALEARTLPFDVRGSAIYVPAAERDALRMALAGEGLPSSGGQGYELLDTLSGFGTTAQMFDAAYWRAKEGELARTITASRHVSAARVHIANPGTGPFDRGSVSAASVTVTTVSPLSAAHVDALRHLVSSAVSGLEAANVSIIDSQSGLIPADGAGQMSPGGTAQTLADSLRANVLRLVEARVGVGNVRVEAHVDTITEREAISERRFDPDSRVAISSETEETSTRAADQNSGAVTVASNLPEGDAGGSANSSESNETRSREIVNFEVSETLRDVVREPGGIRRLSIAVLVNGLVSTAEDGTIAWEPRPDSEIAVLRDLVASAVGFNAERGDQLTIHSMQFDSPEVDAPVETASFIDSFSLDVMSLIQLATLALVSLILGLFVVRPLLMSSSRAPTAALPRPERAEGPEDDFPALPPLDGELSGQGEGFSGLPDLPGLPDFGDMNGGGASNDPADRIRQLLADRQDEGIEVLARWMQDAGEAAQ
ncbi:flagellar basal-body MS-ring/collar protein FliF [Kangsaoukella pontilimi]|nr:flagellar basal-body MS-ring/collar protein FliF [Kangsaoukella pontilimi]